MVKYDGRSVKLSGERAASRASVDTRRELAPAQRQNEVRPSPQPQECRSLPSFTTLSGARSALRSGEVSPLEVLAACRDRIEQSEAGLGAWRAWDPGVTEAEANRIGAARRIHSRTRVSPGAISRTIAGKSFVLRLTRRGSYFTIRLTNRTV